MGAHASLTAPVHRDHNRAGLRVGRATRSTRTGFERSADGPVHRTGRRLDRRAVAGRAGRAAALRADPLRRRPADLRLGRLVRPGRRLGAGELRHLRASTGPPSTRARLASAGPRACRHRRCARACMCWAACSGRSRSRRWPRSPTAGPARDTMLLLALGAAAICIFFSAPVAAGAADRRAGGHAPRRSALFLDPRRAAAGAHRLAATALGFALSLILNRLLRRQFALAAEREKLIDERARSLGRGRAAGQVQVRPRGHPVARDPNGLTGVAHVLAAAAGAGRPRRALARAAGRRAGRGQRPDRGAQRHARHRDRRGRAPVARASAPFDPARLVRELVLLNRPQAAAKGLELAIHVDECLGGRAAGAVVGDAARARQVLSNLLGNAVKYTVRGRIEVARRAARRRPHARRGGRHRPWPRRRGAGAGLRAVQPHRAHRRRRARRGPWPVAVARSWPNLMGGELAAESAVGVGSCFRLDLPFDPAAPIASPPPRAGARRRAAACRAPALKVLVAEDDALDAAMLRARAGAARPPGAARPRRPARLRSGPDLRGRPDHAGRAHAARWTGRSRRAPSAQLHGPRRPGADHRGHRRRRPRRRAPASTRAPMQVLRKPVTRRQRRPRHRRGDRASAASGAPTRPSRGSIAAAASDRTRSISDENIDCGPQARPAVVAAARGRAAPDPPPPAPARSGRSAGRRRIAMKPWSAPGRAAAARPRGAARRPATSGSA